MLQQYAKGNYDIIQNHIKDAMLKCEHHIYVGKESFATNFAPDWVCLDKTKERLEEDGFEFYEHSFDEWKISW